MEITRLKSSVHVGLFEDRNITKNLYDNAIPYIFVEAINKAINSYLLTHADQNGLIHYFTGNDEVYENFDMNLIHQSV